MQQLSRNMLYLHSEKATKIQFLAARCAAVAQLVERRFRKA